MNNADKSLMFMPIPGSRLDYNLKILERIRQFFIDYPDMRWGQGMINMGLMKDEMDAWMIESEEVYKRLKENMGESSQERAQTAMEIITKALKEAGLNGGKVSFDKDGNIVYNPDARAAEAELNPGGDDPDTKEDTTKRDHMDVVLEAYDEWEGDIEPIIDVVIEDFDVDKAAEMYEHNGWRWYRSGRDVIPTADMIEDQLRSLARTLCGELILKWKNRKEDKDLQYKMATGRLEVTGFIEAGDTPDLIILTMNLVPMSATNWE